METLENNEAIEIVPALEATAASEAVDTSTPVEQTQVVEGEKDPQQQVPKTFTQEEMDRVVAKEKAKARRQVERELANRASEQPVPQTPVIREQFPNDEAFIEALIDRKASEKLVQQQIQRQQSDAWATHSDREEDAREKHKDYDRVTRAYGSYAATPDMAQAIITSKNGPDILYHLASNPDDSIRIAQLSPIEQIREIGKIEAKLTLSAETPVRTSSAPAPIAPLNSKASVPVLDTSDPRSDREMNDSQWIEAENARVRARLKAARG